MKFYTIQTSKYNMIYSSLKGIYGKGRYTKQHLYWQQINNIMVNLSTKRNITINADMLHA